MKKILFVALAALLASGAYAQEQDFGSSGNIPSGSVSLPGDVTGTLDLAHGGTDVVSCTSGGVLYCVGGANWSASPVLTNHAVLLGAGAGQPPTPMSVAGANTFLAGAAGADPTFRAVNIASADVSGILPKANGGTGYAPGATTCTASNFGTGAIQANSDDESGTCVVTGTNASANGSVVIAFSQTAANGWRCLFEPDDGAQDWVSGSVCKANDRSTTTATGACTNTNASGTGTNLANATAYWVTYRCKPY